MYGEIELSDIQKEIDVAVTIYEEEVLGLPKLVNTSAPKCMDMPISELKLKSPDELAEYIIELTRYSLYIQRVINKNRSWDRWSKSKLDEIAAAIIPQLDKRYGYNERELIARNNSPLCKKINEFLRQIRMNTDRLYGVPDIIKQMSLNISGLKYTAIQREKDFNN